MYESRFSSSFSSLLFSFWSWTFFVLRRVISSLSLFICYLSSNCSSYNFSFSFLMFLGSFRFSGIEEGGLRNNALMLELVVWVLNSRLFVIQKVGVLLLFNDFFISLLFVPVFHRVWWLTVGFPNNCGSRANGWQLLGSVSLRHLLFGLGAFRPSFEVQRLNRGDCLQSEVCFESRTQ